MKTTLLSLLRPGVAALFLLLSTLASPGLAATLTVTNTGDSGAGSLRAAIATAASGDLIVFNIPTGDPGYNASSGIYTIALSTVGDNTFGPSALLVDKTLTIDGGASKITMTRDTVAQPARFRFFYVAAAGDLTLRNLTLSNGLAAGGNNGDGGGAAGLGGAIVNAGGLKIFGCTFTGNVARGGSNSLSIGIGGGIGLGGPSANGLDGGPPNGGLSNGPKDGGFGGGGGFGQNGGSANPALVGEGGKGGFGGGGGGAATSFNNFGSGFAADGGFGGGGGGLRFSNNGGGRFGLGGFGAGQGTTSGCGPSSGGGGAGFGGAIFNYGGAVAVVNSTLTGNRANGGTGSNCGNRPTNGAGVGGAIFNLNGAIQITNATIANNIAPQGGGAIYTLGDNGIATQAGPILRSTSAASPASVTLYNSILAGSNNGAGTPALVSDFIQATNNSNQIGGAASGVVSSGGVSNLIQTRASGSNDFGGTAGSGDPQLRSLGYYGGPTPTMPMLPASPAIDAGNNALAVDANSNPLTGDQRGFARFVKGRASSANATVDLGAYELAGPPTFANANVNLPSGSTTPLNLTNAMGPSPSGGVFSGTGVTFSNGNYLFDPAGRSDGVYTLTYTVTDQFGVETTATCTVTLGTSSSIVVNTTRDTAVNPNNGTRSLREALASALGLGGPQTITFNIPTSDPGYNAGTGVYAITLYGAELPVSGQVTITGPGAAVLTVNGNNASRVFNIAAGARVSISGVTVMGGHAPDGTSASGNCNYAGSAAGGGGILVAGDLTLQSCFISGNTAGRGGSSDLFVGGAGGHGGGILVGNSGTLTITGTTISDNRAGGGGNVAQPQVCFVGGTVFGRAGPGGHGGGIHVNTGGALLASSSTISGNRAGAGGLVDGCSGQCGNGQDGSGAGVAGDGALTLQNVIVTNNTNAAYGGGISSGGSLVADNVAVSNNQASSGGGGINAGGSSVVLRHSLISGNSTPGTAGGLQLYYLPRVLVSNSTISGNTATGNSGGINVDNSTVQLVNATITNNTAGGNFGGVLNSNGTVRAINTIIGANQAGQSAVDFSGTLTSLGYNLIGNTTGTTITGTTTGNLLNQPAGLAALSDNGGPTRTHALQAASVAINAGNDVTTLASGLTGTSTAVVVADSRGFSVGQTIRVGSEQMLVAVITTSNNTLAVTRAVNGTAAAPHSAGAGVNPAFDQRGQARKIGPVDMGAFEFDPGFTPSLVVTTTVDEDDGSSDPGLGAGTSLREALRYANTLTGAQTITFAPGLAGQTVTLSAGWNNAGDSAALRAARQITVQGPTTAPGVTLAIASGVAKRHFYVEPFAELTLANLTLTGGNVSDFGGAIWNAGTLTVRACTLSGNSAGAQGGAIQSNFGTALSVENSTISGNTSGNVASSIATGASPSTFRNVTITNNTGPAGTLYLYDTATTMVNSIVAGNSNDAIDTFGSGAFNAQSTNNILRASSAAGLTNGTNGNFTGVTAAQLQLGTLADNGGPTRTVSLLPGSLAVNRGVALAGQTTDQRGKLRPQFGVVDIGAFEQTAFDTGQTIVTAGGASWYLGPDAVGNDLRIYREVPGEAPVEVGGLAVRIGLAIDGTVLVQNAGGGVFARVGSTTGIGSGYQQLQSVVAGDGANWFLGPDGFGSDFYIYRWAAGGLPAYSGGFGVQLLVTPDGFIITRNAAGNSYYRLGSNAGLGTAWPQLFESLVVTTATDENNGTSDASIGTGTSLREAVAYANALGTAQTITFTPTLAGQTVVLRDPSGNANAYETGSALYILGQITLQGPGTGPGVTLQIDPAVERRHFLVNGGTSLTLVNLTLTGGKALLPFHDYGGSVWSFGALTVRGCTFSGNFAGEGGAIQSWGGSPLLAIDNSTFTGNTSNGIAGAIDSGATSATFRHLTITNNSAAGGDAVVLYQSSVTMLNSIIAGNVNDGVGSVNGGAFSAQSTNNILGSGGTGGLTNGVNGNVTGATASQLALSGLADNGGPTRTIALQGSSIAVDAGATISGLTTDQRGIARPFGSAPDIGAFELNASTNANLIVLSMSGGSLSPSFSSGTTSYSAVVRNATASVTVTPAIADASATARVRVNSGTWSSVASGQASPTLALNVGSNSIEVEITAQAGNTRSYGIAVTRAAAGLQDWRAHYFGTIANEGIAANTANPDSDLLNNAQEFAFGTNPVIAQSDVVSYSGNIITAGSPTVLVENTQYAVNYYALYSRRKDYADVGLTYTVQFSADMIAWAESTATPAVRADNGILEVVTVPYPFFIDGRKALFFRVVVDLP